MSAGIRSGVNWMRLYWRCRARAMVLTSRVLPSPGRPSRSTCPPAISAIVTPRITSSWPTITRATSRSSASTVLRSRSMSCAAAARPSALTLVCVIRSPPGRRASHSSEIDPHHRALFAGNQVLFGRHLARLLSLDQLGHIPATDGWIGADLVLSPVGRPYARAAVQLRRHLNALAGRIQPRRLVAEHVGVSARANSRPSLLPGGTRTLSTRPPLPLCRLRPGASGALLTRARRLTSRASALSRGLLLQLADVARQLIRRYAARAAALHLVAQTTQRLALFAVRCATQRLSRLALLVGQLSIGLSTRGGRILQGFSELLLGRVRELVSFVAQVLQLAARRPEIALLDRIGGRLSGRHAAERL